MTWTNWSGSASADARVRRPGSEAAVRDLVAAADGTVRVAGSGHSFPPVVPTDDVLVSLERLTGLVDADPGAGTATVRAGTRLSALTAALGERGLMLENMGDVDEQTVAGALATGTHGTGIDYGVLATAVERLRLVTADGGVRELTPEDGDPFRAAQVSLGALGVVTEVTLSVVPDYHLRERKRPMPIEDALAGLDDRRERHDHAEFWWFPGTETALVKTLDRIQDPGVNESGDGTSDRTDDGTADGIRAGRVLDLDLEERLENAVWEAVCRAGDRLPAAAGPLNRFVTATFGESERVGPARELFPTRRDVRFDETEWGVPAPAGERAFRAVRETVRDHSGVQFPVEFRDVAGDDVPLSPASGRDSVFIACHAYHRKPHEPFLRDCCRTLAAFDGRPHWGKHHWETAATLRPSYPEWDLFQDVRREFDPDGLFLNDHLRRLFDE